MNILNRKKLYFVVLLIFWSSLKVYAFDFDDFDCERADGACGDTSPPPTYIKFKNRCSHPIQLAINYQDIMGNWKMKYWYTLSSNEESFLAASNGKNLTTTSSILYYYAKATDNSGLVWEGNNNIDKFKMRKIKDTAGNIDWAITCN